MLESLLSFILNKQLTGLLANFSSSNLEINLRAGRLLLQGLSLLPEATAGWGLPFAIKSATYHRSAGGPASVAAEAAGQP